jgi:hypothetical protein
MKYIKNTKITIVIISLVIGVFIEICGLNYYQISNRLNSLDRKNLSYDILQVEKINYTHYNNSFITEENPYIVIMNVKTYIKNINISGDISVKNIPVQIFYTDSESDSFTEEKSIRKEILYFDTNSNIVINTNVKDIRIDLGDNAGVIIDDLRIDINPVKFKINILRMLVFTLCSFLVGVFIVKYKGRYLNNRKKLRYVSYSFFIILLVRVIFYSILTPYFLTPDSYSYIGINSMQFLSFRLDEVRVPLYPIIIDLIRLVFGVEYYINAIVALQIIVSFMSVVVFYKILNLVVNKKSIAILMTILYGCAPSIMGWDKTILTESLALSGTVFFIYLMISYTKKPSVKQGLGSSILALFLTLLRPTFLIILLICIAFWVVRYLLIKGQRNLTGKCLISSIVSLLIIFVYASLFHSQFGVFSLSNTLLGQEVFTIVQKGYYKNSQDKEVIRLIDEKIIEDKGEFIQAIGIVYEKYSSREALTNFIRDSKHNSKNKYVRDKVETVIRLADIKFPNNAWYSFNLNEPGFHQDIKGNTYYKIEGNLNQTIEALIRGIAPAITFAHVYLIIIIETILMIFLWYKNKTAPWVHMGILSIVSATLLSAIMGTFAEWGRTAICVLPYCYMVITMYIEYIIQGKVE